MGFPPDYVERVYAGVLGKVIGVYLGRPIEGWTYERITRELGEIEGYVHDRLGKPLVVTDDDLSGTFTFIRAFPDHGHPRQLTPAQIGLTWLNYLIEHQTVLWWGGLGNSSEHTAYLRLLAGIPAPRSGSAELNGGVLAEQIGAQIFIDGWAMISPGDPERAADLARRAASVSHDGEAIHAAQVVAAMEAQAFIERDIDRLLDTGMALIPHDSTIYALLADLREWRAAEPDWRRARERVAERYGYDRYGGNCHVVPNHALIALGLLYGEGDFHRSLRIVNTCGWDTDCNSGNLGCLLGIRGGLRAFEGGPDWRGPVADRLLLSTAEGGSAIADAVSTTYRIVNTARALEGMPPLEPKGGSRFHFELPGSVQGFRSVDGCLENVPDHSRWGSRALALRSAGEARFGTATFIPPEALDLPPPYSLVACPTLFSGQTLRAGLSGDADLRAHPYVLVYDADDRSSLIQGPEATLIGGAYQEMEWQVPDTGGGPIHEVGVSLQGHGTAYLDHLDWDGAPQVTLTRPAPTNLATPGPLLWRRAWVSAVDQWEPRWPQSFRLVQNRGRGLIAQGTRQWRDYEVSAEITPTLIRATGLAARYQGLRRYYALLLREGHRVELVKVRDTERVLAQAAVAWEVWRPYRLQLALDGRTILGWVEGDLLFKVSDEDEPLLEGGVGLVCEEGMALCEAVQVRPLARPKRRDETGMARSEA